MAVSVEALVFIVIGRSCSEGCGFGSHCRPDSFLRFYSRPIMYGVVGSLILSEVLGPSSWVKIPARASGFDRVMTLSKSCTYERALANQAIHPLVVGKLVQAICRGVIIPVR